MTQHMDYPAPVSGSSFVTTEVNGEVLIYDRGSEHIHHLNATSAAIWKLCDGTRSEAQIAAGAGDALGTPVDLDVVRMAVVKLAEAGLIEPGSGRIDRHAGSRRSRRALIRTMAAGGVAIPMIASVSAPAAASTISQLCQDYPNTYDCNDLNNNEKCCRDTSGCYGKCGDSICNALSGGCV